MADAHQVFPRRVDYSLDSPDPRQNAQVLRHRVKNQLNSLNLCARCLLNDHHDAEREHGPGKGLFKAEVVEFLRAVQGTVDETSAFIDQVRELPAQHVEQPRRA